MSNGYRYRIMGRRFLGEERLYGQMPQGTWEVDALSALANAQADAKKHGRWSHLRLERSLPEWEPVP